MNGHHQGDVPAMVESRRGDGHHGLLAAAGIVIGEEADGGELRPQLLQDMADRRGHFVAIQRADQVDGLGKRGRRPVDVVAPLAGVFQDAFQAPCSIGVVTCAAADPRPPLVVDIPGGEGDPEARDDRQDISDLLVRYATGIDRRDWPLFRTVFTDDCELDYGEIGAWQGVDDVTEFMTRVHAMAGHTLHRLSNQAIAVDGDTAVARTYVDALIMIGDDQSGVNGVGFYDDEIVRTAVGWRIARRQFTAVRVSAVGGPE